MQVHKMDARQFIGERSHIAVNLRADNHIKIHNVRGISDISYIQIRQSSVAQYSIRCCRYPQGALDR